jgi:hypothetical protein
MAASQLEAEWKLSTAEIIVGMAHKWLSGVPRRVNPRLDHEEDAQVENRRSGNGSESVRLDLFVYRRLLVVMCTDAG